MDPTKKEVLIDYLKIVSFFSDKQLQIRRWMYGEGPDFSETTCYFFDLGNYVLDDYRSFGMNDKQYRILTNFRDELRTYDDNHNFMIAQQFIDSPEWATIMKKAKETLCAFHKAEKRSLCTKVFSCLSSLATRFFKQ
jgi:hypothetical protein